MIKMNLCLVSLLTFPAHLFKVLLIINIMKINNIQIAINMDLSTMKLDK